MRLVDRMVGGFKGWKRTLQLVSGYAGGRFRSRKWSGERNDRTGGVRSEGKV